MLPCVTTSPVAEPTYWIYMKFIRIPEDVEKIWYQLVAV